MRRFLAWVAYRYIQFVFGTTQWERQGEQYPQIYWQAQKPFIVCFWHSRLLMVAYAWRSTMPFSMLISQHADGEIIARTVGHLGIRWIPGSSSKQGTQALRALRQALKEGSTIGVTPDGPRGPRYQVAPGVVRLALLMGVDILPLTFSVRRGRFLKSWDRFLLAFPLTRGVLMWGEPLQAHAYQSQADQMEQDLHKSLMTLTQEADHLCGHVTPS